jgi:general secretion pathway protein C
MRITPTSIAAVRGLSSRVSGDAAKLACLGLLVLGAAESVHLTMALWRGVHHFNGGSSAPTTPAVRLVPGTQSIVGAHLFGLAPPGRDSSVVAAAPPNLVLDGTVASKDPKRGMAIINDGGHSGLYAVGDHIGDASLHSVYADHVILNREGTFVTLQWRHTALIAGMTGPQSTGSRTHKAGNYLDNLGRVVDSPPSQLDGIIRTMNMVDDSTGKLQGLRVYPVASGTPMRILGLSPGDLITAINGTALADLKAGPNILNSIQSMPQATVTVERQGHQMDLVLNIADATRSLAAESDQAPAE